MAVCLWKREIACRWCKRRRGTRACESGKSRLCSLDVAAAATAIFRRIRLFWRYAVSNDDNDDDNERKILRALRLSSLTTFVASLESVTQFDLSIVRKYIQYVIRVLREKKYSFVILRLFAFNTRIMRKIQFIPRKIQFDSIELLLMQCERNNGISLK